MVQEGNYHVNSPYVKRLGLTTGLLVYVSLHTWSLTWILIILSIMAWLQNGPIPTKLTLLSDLPKFPPGSKVRFLGWYVRLLRYYNILLFIMYSVIAAAFT